MSELIRWGGVVLAREADNVSGLGGNLDRLTQVSRPLRKTAGKARDRRAAMVTLRFDVTKVAFATPSAARLWAVAHLREMQAIDTATSSTTLTWDFSAVGGAFVVTIADTVVRVSDLTVQGVKVQLTYEVIGGLITSPDPDTIA